MRVKFLLGPAGSGKTWRCLHEARAALKRSAEGLPLTFIAPKQATYQLERQLLDTASPSAGLTGFTRLRIVSFEKLARFIFALAGRAEPNLLNEAGRIMVLRALLAQHQPRLKLFRAIPIHRDGFAQELSRLLRDLQQSRCSTARLNALIDRAGGKNRLKEKLSDIVLLLGEYENWLDQHHLHDSDRLLELAAELLENCPAIRFEALWLDGFARLNTQERAFLKALARHCTKMTLAFCLDQQRATEPWHSHWHIVGRTVRELKEDLESVKGVVVELEELGRTLPLQTRFSSSPELQHLERHWADPKPYANANSSLQSIRLAQCADPEAEAIFAAREILRFVRDGGRFRDAAILVRQLDPYHDILRRVFLRYEIPFFLDRREPIAHHPLAELTRAALRTVAFNWRRQDWFCALKSGLLPATQNEIDRLENLALARGWEGNAWQNPLAIRNDPALTERVEKLRQKLVRPFSNLSQRLGPHPTGTQLSEALRNFWKELAVEERLEKWSTSSTESSRAHLTVWDQLQEWLEMLALAFGTPQPLKQWLPIVESGLSALTVGAVPPVLDQVLLGAVDRSRNPDLQHVFVLGLNETVFPARSIANPILTDADRDLLESEGLAIGQNARLHSAQERFLGYIACTRARQSLTMMYALRDSQGTALNPSSLVAHVKWLFPQLAEAEIFEADTPWDQAEHSCELISPLLCARAIDTDRSQQSKPTDEPGGERLAQRDAITRLGQLPKLASILQDLASPTSPELSADLAQAVYGPVNSTSVSALEKFASCPFWYFVEHGLGAQERKRFELDARERGTFQHQVLERFHRALKLQGRSWHSITQEEARDVIAKIADELIESFGEGVLLATPENRFVAGDQKERLQRLIEVLIGWMKQYEFEPAEVELRFGLDQSALPAWKIALENGKTLALRGSIDRVDLYRKKTNDEALCVVMDYKSNAKEIDRVLMEHGIQLQLPAYLAALGGIPAAAQLLSGRQLRPVGVFFVNLRGKYESANNRDEVLGDSESARKHAFRHEGLFDSEALDLLDNRNAATGDQFAYTRKSDGTLSGQVKNAMVTSDFTQLLHETEKRIREFGDRLYKGNIAIDPFKKGALHACTRCHHSAICRIDPWTHPFRNLKKDVGA